MTPPRVLFCAWPFEGHVFPLLSVALAHRARGGEAAFYTSARWRPTIGAQEMELLPFRRVEGVWERVHMRERSTRVRQRQSLRVRREAFREWLVESIPSQVSDLREAMADWRPDVIVTDGSMWGPSLVLHETTPIPVAFASTLIFALIPGPDAPPPGSRMTRAPRSAGDRARARAVSRVIDLLAAGTRRRLDEVRAGYGLPPLRCSVNEFMGRLPLYLVGSVPELDLMRADLPGSVRYVGPLSWHPPGSPETLEWLAAIPVDRPWVHVTEGTSHYQDPFLLRAAASGLPGADVEAILTTGSERDPAALGLGATAANVHVTRWLSHSELLPRCAAVVSTGGAQTIVAALKAGVPLVIVPTGWDKPANAARAEQAGVAVRLAPKECTPAALRDAVNRVLADPRFRDAAARIAQRLAAAPGPAGAAELIEAILAVDDGHRPGPAPGIDPFTIEATSQAPRRPRLTSHAGRSGRARRWLPDDALRVLDIGCSTGYGSAGIAVAGPPGRVVVGIEHDPTNLAEAHWRFPWLTILEGDATALEISDSCADAVLLLDVVEHLADPARAIAEAHRVLRPGGMLVLSVPHRGPLRGLDALNVYQALRRRRPSWPPLQDATQSGSGTHLHFSPGELERLLAPGFAIDRRTRTGLGLAELVHLSWLVSRARLSAPRASATLGWLYVLAYLLEDVLPTGPLGYHLTVRARARGVDSRAVPSSGTARVGAPA